MEAAVKSNELVNSTKVTEITTNPINSTKSLEKLFLDQIRKRKSRDELEKAVNVLEALSSAATHLIHFIPILEVKEKVEAVHSIVDAFMKKKVRSAPSLTNTVGHSQTYDDFNYSNDGEETVYEEESKSADTTGGRQ